MPPHVQLHDCAGGDDKARALSAEVRASAAKSLPASYASNRTDCSTPSPQTEFFQICVISSRFSVGGFAPGVAVQPILLDYSANKHFNPGWGLDESTIWHMWRVFTQLRTHIRLQVLPVSSAPWCDTYPLLASLSCHALDGFGGPSIVIQQLRKRRCHGAQQQQNEARVFILLLQVYHPSEEEKEDPKLYAENVRRLMGQQLNAPLVDYGTREEFLLKTAGVHIDMSGRNLCLKKPGMAKPVLLARLDKLPAPKA